MFALRSFVVVHGLILAFLVRVFLCYDSAMEVGNRIGFRGCLGGSAGEMSRQARRDKVNGGLCGRYSVSGSGVMV